MSNTDFDFLNNDYDLEYEKTNFLLDFNKNLSNYNVPNNYQINNYSDFKSFTELVLNFKYDVKTFNPSLLWLNNEKLKNFVELNKLNYDNLISKETNNILNEKLIINENLDKIKNLLNLDTLPKLEQISNLFNFPDNFNINKINEIFKIPDLKIESFDDLKKIFNVDNLTVALNSIGSIELPSIGSIELPKLSSLTTGLNFERMSKTIEDAQLKDFPESTPWETVIKYQATIVTKAVFTELSKMTFYIEPGEINILSNGSPSTHQGKNINRIKIKLK